MRTITFFEGVMRSLTKDQKDEIRSTDKEYVDFNISVSNAGAVIRTEMTDHLREIPEDEWNGYDFTSSTAEVVRFLDRNDL